MTTLSAWLLNKSSGISELDSAGITKSDMAGASPIKSRFLFSVEFETRQNIYGDNNDLLGSESLGEIAYDLKAATRPNVSVNYEDANYYGYRTKVATRISYGTVSLTFYEDSINRANDLVWRYINTISPISRHDSAGTSFSTEPEGKQTVGPLAINAQDGIFKSMKVHHYYPISNGYGHTVYTYLNPKLETVQYDDLDMSVSEASTLTLVFVYDGVNVQHLHTPPVDVEYSAEYVDNIISPGEQTNIPSIPILSPDGSGIA